jgi:hypothetical protein
MEYIAILAFILGLPFTYTQLEVKKIENKYPPLGYFNNIDGYNIHYTDIGSGQPIVLLHSQPANERQFDIVKDQMKIHQKDYLFKLTSFQNFYKK